GAGETLHGRLVIWKKLQDRQISLFRVGIILRGSVRQTLQDVRRSVGRVLTDQACGRLKNLIVLAKQEGAEGELVLVHLVRAAAAQLPDRRFVIPRGLELMQPHLTLYQSSPIMQVAGAQGNGSYRVSVSLYQLSPVQITVTGPHVNFCRDVVAGSPRSRRD